MCQDNIKEEKNNYTAEAIFLLTQHQSIILSVLHESNGKFSKSFVSQENHIKRQYESVQKRRVITENSKKMYPLLFVIAEPN